MCLSDTTPLKIPTIKSDTATKILETKTGSSNLKTKDINGIKPAIPNEKNETKPFFIGLDPNLIFFPSLCSYSISDFTPRYEPVDIDNPSANKLARPRITTTEGERDAPKEPATTAKVVTMPSLAERTMSLT